MTLLTDLYLPANRQLPLRWVSGNSYALDADVWSPVNGHLYRRIVAGAGATDPSSDATNWKIIAPGGVKSVQRGTLAISSVDGSGLTFDTTVTAVNTAKATLSVLGSTVTSGYTEQQTRAILQLINSTTIRATRLSSGGGGGTAANYSWELVEYL